MKQKEFKNICVSLLGDIINTSPVFRRLRECYPDSKIDIVTINPGIPATYGIKEIDDRFVLEKRKGLKGLLYQYKFAQKLKKYDLYVVLDNSTRSALLPFFAGIKNRIGRKGQMKELFLTDVIDFTDEEKKNEVPVAEYYYRCLKPLGIYDGNSKTCYSYSREDDEFVDKLIQENCKTDKKKLGICLLCGNLDKSVEMEDAVKIVNKLKEHDEYEIIATGGIDATPRIQQLLAKTDNAFIDLSGKTSFLQTACLINKCSKFISVDTSVAHLAVAQNTPLVSLFYTNIFKKWGPKDLNYNKVIVNLNSKKTDADEVVKNFCNIPDKIVNSQ